jgi:hypothetical protein
MRKLEVAPFDRALRNDAASLFAEGFTRMRRQVPVLPGTLELPDAAATRLDGLFRNCTGGMVREQDQLGGYLGWYILDDFRGTGRRAAYCPVWGHATTPEGAAEIYRALYRAASRQWCAAGCEVHALSVLASDEEARDAWFWNGFGLTVVDAIRPTSCLGVTRLPRGPIRKARPDDAETVAALEREHWHHYTQPPVLMPVDPPADADTLRSFLADPVAGYWLAFRGEEPVGFLRFETNAEGASDVVRSGTTVAIAAVTSGPSTGGRGWPRPCWTRPCASSRPRVHPVFGGLRVVQPRGRVVLAAVLLPVCYSMIRVRRPRPSGPSDRTAARPPPPGTREVGTGVAGGQLRGGRWSAGGQLRARSLAAAAAASTAPRTARSSSCRNARGRGTSRAGHPFPEQPGVGPGLPQHGRRPDQVCTASSVAAGRGSPNSTPASIMDSARWNRYAGPDPLIAVTASCWYSGTQIVLPLARNSSSARARWSSVHRVPAERAAIPSPTSAGMFGITRTTATWSVRCASMSGPGIPAATEMTSVPGWSSSRTPSNRSIRSPV